MQNFVDAGINPVSPNVSVSNGRFSRHHMTAHKAIASMLMISLLTAGAANAAETNPLADKVRSANQRFADVAVAKSEGYAPIPCVSGPDGKLELVAVEYITPKGPAALGNQLFSFVNAPNRYGLPPFYELHVWAWRANATGTFSDMNPDVSCAAMMDGM
jgi:hypothetical protein